MMAETLRSMRLSTGLSQTQFARAMGLSRATYQKLEYGVVPVREVYLQAARYAVLVFSGKLAKLADPVPCAHIADYYDRRQRKHKCIGFNLLRWGYRQWAVGGAIDPQNNLYGEK